MSETPVSLNDFCLKGLIFFVLEAQPELRKLSTLLKSGIQLQGLV